MNIIIHSFIIPHIIGLEIQFEDIDYPIEEGSGLSDPIRLLFRTNQNPFTITFSPVTIAALEGMGMDHLSHYVYDIYEESRAKLFFLVEDTVNSFPANPFHCQLQLKESLRSCPPHSRTCIYS